MNTASEYIENGVQIQEVDARELEVQLVRTAALMDRHQPFVVLLTHYEELVQTEHKLDYMLLGKLLGVRIGLVIDGTNRSPNDRLLYANSLLSTLTRSLYMTSLLRARALYMERLIPFSCFSLLLISNVAERSSLIYGLSRHALCSP